MTKRCRKCSRDFKYCPNDNAPTNPMCLRCFVQSDEYQQCDIAEASLYYGIDLSEIELFDVVKECVKTHESGQPGHAIFTTAECLNCRFSRKLRRPDGTWRSVYYRGLSRLAKEYGLDLVDVVRSLEALSERQCYMMTGN
jgi:hypothetical protein